MLYTGSKKYITSDAILKWTYLENAMDEEWGRIVMMNHLLFVMISIVISHNIESGFFSLVCIIDSLWENERVKGCIRYV